MRLSHFCQYSSIITLRPKSIFFTLEQCFITKYLPSPDEVAWQDLSFTANIEINCLKLCRNKLSVFTKLLFSLETFQILKFGNKLCIPSTINLGLTLNPVLNLEFSRDSFPSTSPHPYKQFRF